MREHADRRYRLDQDGPLVEEFVCGADALVRAGPPGPALLSTKPVSIRARVLDAEPRLLPGDRNEARAARGRSY
jgi:hypothetical protein